MAFPICVDCSSASVRPAAIFFRGHTLENGNTWGPPERDRGSPVAEMWQLRMGLPMEFEKKGGFDALRWASDINYLAHNNLAVPS